MSGRWRLSNHPPSAAGGRGGGRTPRWSGYGSGVADADGYPARVWGTTVSARFLEVSSGARTCGRSESNGWCDAQYRQDRTASGLREREREAVGPPLERQRLLVTDQLDGCDGRRKMRRAFGKGSDGQSPRGHPGWRNDVGASGEPDVFSGVVGAVRSLRKESVTLVGPSPRTATDGCRRSPRR